MLKRSRTTPQVGNPATLESIMQKTAIRATMVVTMIWSYKKKVISSISLLMDINSNSNLWTNDNTKAKVITKVTLLLNLLAERIKMGSTVRVLVALS